MNNLILIAAISENSVIGKDGKMQAFPSQYELFLTSSDNTRWVSMGIFGVQPNPLGQVDIKLSPYLTYGVLVRPITMTVDDNGAYYFQLCDLKLTN